MRLFGRNESYPQPPKALRGGQKITMLRTVWFPARDGLPSFELLANRTYNLGAKLADEMLLKGYADGTTSRPYSEQERERIEAGVQRVRI